MKKLVLLLALSCTLVGCRDSYRYSCQDPANKDKAECNHPACDDDGLCYDKLNGFPTKEPITQQLEESPVTAAEPPKENCNCENKGE